MPDGNPLCISPGPEAVSNAAVLRATVLLRVLLSPICVVYPTEVSIRWNVTAPTLMFLPLLGPLGSALPILRRLHLLPQQSHVVH